MKPICCLVLLLTLWVGQTHFAFAQKTKPIDPELQKLKTNLAAAKHDTTKMMAYVDISIHLSDVILQLDSALMCGLKAEQIAKRYPNCSTIPKVWNVIGNIYSSKSDADTDPARRVAYSEAAIRYYEQGIKDAQRLGNEEYALRVHYNLILQLSHTDSTYQYWKGSLGLIRKIETKPALNTIDSFMVNRLYRGLCNRLDYDMEGTYFNKYLNRYRTLINKEGSEYENLCLLELDQYSNTWKKADEQRFLKEYNNFKKLVQSVNVKDELDLYLANYYFNIEDYRKSYQISAAFMPQDYEEVPAGTSTKFAYLSVKFMNMGRCAFMLGENQEAIQYLSKANTYIKQERASRGLEYEYYTTLSYLSKAYKKAGDYKQAFDYLQQAEEVYKQLHNKQTQALMAENDVQLEEIKQDKQVQEARTQTLLKEQEIKIQKKQKYMMLGLLVFMLLVAIWALYNFQKKRTLSKRLETKNQIISQQAATLAESNHLKDKIFALLSHDLRSPINRLVGSLSQSVETQHTHIQIELKVVQDILNNVLYWASTQLKKTSPVYTNIPLQPLADALIDEYQYALEEKSITFLNTIDKDCFIKTDEGYLKIVLRNLISNAIKFTPNNGYIQIDCKIKEKIGEISLKDTGIGIAAEKIDNLFHLPVPSAGTNQEKGTGLGLGLSLDIMKKLGGSLNIKSQEGKGTQVLVALPLVA